MPETIRISKLHPVFATGEDNQTRSIVLYPGGAIPRFGVEIESPRKARRIVRVDPITGVPQVEVSQVRAGQRGFTLLEVLVATVMLAVAISGLMSALSTSLRGASRVTEYDRAAMLARRKMDEIIAERRLPRNMMFEGAYNPAETNGSPSGWRAQVAGFELPPNPRPGVPIVDRIDVKCGGWTARHGELLMSRDSVATI